MGPLVIHELAHTCFLDIFGVNGQADRETEVVQEVLRHIEINLRTVAIRKKKMLPMQK